MSVEPEQLKVQVNERESVTALLYLAEKRNRIATTLILGHGAGGNQMSAFMRLFARGLADRGIDAVTFNFLYSEHGRGAPDPKARLELCYQSVIRTALDQRKLKGNRLAIGGKSMGGRIASQVAADWNAVTESTSSDGKQGGKKVVNRPSADLAGLVFLGYPLHPPGKPEQLRDKHLKDVQAPMLFIQGTRDAFGSPEELREVIKRLRLQAKLHLIDEGDHSFKVPKRTGLTTDQVYESVMDEIKTWLSSRRDKLAAD
jgi:uncharacterized protein